MGSLKEHIGCGCLVLDPALVVTGHVVPARLKLVVHGPHEMALHRTVENGDRALAEAHDISLTVVVRVNSTGARFDESVVIRVGTLTKWAKPISCPVEVNAMLWHVRLRAVDALAWP